jgi:diguanylate cyclase
MDQQVERGWAAALVRRQARRAFDWFTGKDPNEPPEVREARLLTLPDSTFLMVLAIFWSQVVALSAFAISGQRWLLAWAGADALFHGLRIVLKQRHIAAVAAHTRPPHEWLVLVNVIWFSVWSLGILGALGIADVRIAVLASFVPVGFSGYIASRLSAFPRLGVLLLCIISTALTAGLLNSPLPQLWTVGLLGPGLVVAYRLLMLQNHDILISALRAQHENRRLSMHDALTGLPNRLLLRERLLSLTQPSGSGRDEPGFALLCLDLDGFKAVNDRHGHAGGDWLLKSVSARLLGAVRAQDLVCRTGGDEFIVLLPATSRATATQIAERLIAGILQPHDLGRAASARVGVSVGIAIAPEHGREADLLLSRADDALYEAKKNGKCNWRMAQVTVEEHALH